MKQSIEERLRAIEDRFDIMDLKARYCRCNDGGWEGPTHDHIDEVVDMFLEDAVWDGGPVAGRAEGREGIRTLFGHFKAVPFLIHYVMNPIIEISGDEATGHWHAIIPATDPGGQALWTFGMYQERYRRTAQGWKFDYVKFVPAVNSPYELGWAKAPFNHPADAK
jgi:hypothetical protein